MAIIFEWPNIFHSNLVVLCQNEFSINSQNLGPKYPLLAERRRLPSGVVFFGAPCTLYCQGRREKLSSGGGLTDPWAPAHGERGARAYNGVWGRIPLKLKAL